MTTPAQADEKEEIVAEVTELTPEEVTQEADDALESGFNTARGIKPEKPQEKPDTRDRDDKGKFVAKEAAKPAAKVETDTKTVEKVVTEEEDKPSSIPGYTEKQLKMLLSKAPELETKFASETRKLHGKIGELTGLIKQLQTAKPTQENRKIAASALKRLSQNYPQLAEDLAEDLSEAFSASEPAKADPTQPSYPEIEARFNARLNEEKVRMQEEFQEELLTIRHKDWRNIIVKGSPQHEDFKTWWYSLPDEKRKEWDSPKAEVTAAALDAYKALKESTKKVTQKNKERLEAVIAPKGSPAPATPTLSDDDALEYGFKSVRGRR